MREQFLQARSIDERRLQREPGAEQALRLRAFGRGATDQGQLHVRRRRDGVHQRAQAVQGHAGAEEQHLQAPTGRAQATAPARQGRQDR